MAKRPWALVVPGHSRRGRLSGRCRRVLAAAASVAEHDCPELVVFTGRSRRGPSEAEQMLAAWPGRRDVELVAESTARSTAANASRSLPMLVERGIGRATVICAPAHAHRARYLFRRVYAAFGVECDVIAAWRVATPAALAWELAALTVAPRQRLAALAELHGADG